MASIHDPTPTFRWPGIAGQKAIQPLPPFHLVSRFVVSEYIFRANDS